MKSRSEQIGVWIAGIGVTFSSLMVARFLPDEWNVLPAWGWIAIAALSAMIGMAIYDNNARVAAGLGGLVGGACIPFAMIAYVQLRVAFSETFFRVEFLIPIAVGALPGLGIYALIKKLLHERELNRRRNL